MLPLVQAGQRIILEQQRLALRLSAGEPNNKERCLEEGDKTVAMR
jgi:hypothetical protein